jgi:hypothetical protein
MVQGSTTRKVPFVSHGWTVNNPKNAYKNNQWNMLGSIQPSIANGKISGLHPDDMDSIAGLVCEVIKEFSPCGICKTPYFHSDPATLQRAYMHSKNIYAVSANINSKMRRK